jgi:hypothetical protein
MCTDAFLCSHNNNARAAAYVIVNLHGYSFCNAAWVAFGDLIHNAALVFVINSVGFLIIFLCKVIISLGTGLFVYMLIGTMNEGVGGDVCASRCPLFTLFSAPCVPHTALSSLSSPPRVHSSGWLFMPKSLA